MKNGLSAIMPVLVMMRYPLYRSLPVLPTGLATVKRCPNQLFIFNFQCVHRLDMPVRHDQDVCLRNGMDVTKSCHLFIAVYDGRFGFFETILQKIQEFVILAFILDKREMMWIK